MPGAQYWSRSAAVGAATTGLTGLTITDKVSLLAWLFITDQIDVVSHVGATNSAGYALRTIASTNALQLRLHNGTTNNAHQSPSGLLPIGRWCHVAATADLNWVSYYVNRRLAWRTARLGGSLAAPTGTLNTRILNSSGAPTGNRYCKAFDVQLLPNVTLNEAEIDALADPRVLDPRVLGRYFRGWRYPGLSGTVLDESGAGNNIVVNAAVGGCDPCEEPPWRTMLRKPTARRASGRLASTLVALVARARAVVRDRTTAPGLTTALKARARAVAVDRVAAPGLVTALVARARAAVRDRTTAPAVPTALRATARGAPRDRVGVVGALVTVLGRAISRLVARTQTRSPLPVVPPSEWRVTGARGGALQLVAVRTGAARTVAVRPGVLQVQGVRGAAARVVGARAGALQVNNSGRVG